MNVDSRGFDFSTSFPMWLTVTVLFLSPHGFRLWGPSGASRTGLVPAIELNLFTLKSFTINAWNLDAPLPPALPPPLFIFWFCWIVHSLALASLPFLHGDKAAQRLLLLTTKHASSPSAVAASPQQGTRRIFSARLKESSVPQVPPLVMVPRLGVYCCQIDSSK